MAIDTATLLGLLGVAFAGNPITETWSIGGSYPLGLLGGLLSGPSGLSNSHNRYESDSSASRVCISCSMSVFSADGSSTMHTSMVEMGMLWRWHDLIISTTQHMNTHLT